MYITLNGERKDFSGTSNCIELLERLSLDPKQVALEKNGEIITRSRLEAEPVTDGDVVEIVRFIGGG